MIAPVESNAQTRLSQTQANEHPFCYVCSGSNPAGLAVRYETALDGAVQARFLGHCGLEGYSGRLHGGVIAALLDGAMTQCLFARGLRLFTVELCVRYHGPVAAAEELAVRAWLEDERHGLHRLCAELHQGDQLKASATGKFMPQDE